MINNLERNWLGQISMEGYLLSFESGRKQYSCQILSSYPTIQDKRGNFSWVKLIHRKSLGGLYVLPREVGAWDQKESESKATNCSRSELSWSTTWLSLELVKSRVKEFSLPLARLLECLFLFPCWLQHLKSPKLSGPSGVCKENSTSSNWLQARVKLWS